MYRRALLGDDCPKGANCRNVVKIELESFNFGSLHLGQVEIFGLRIKAWLHDRCQCILLLFAKGRGARVLDELDQQLEAVQMCHSVMHRE